MFYSCSEKWPQAVRANGHLLLNSEKVGIFSYLFILIRSCILTIRTDCVSLLYHDYIYRNLNINTM